MIINIPSNKSASGKLLVSNKGINIYLILCILYAIINIIINTYAYGSIEQSLIRFYGIRVVNKSLITYLNYLRPVFGALIALTFVYRYFIVIYNRKSIKFYIAVALLVIVSIPSGSRGATITPFIMLLSADIFAKRFYKISLTKNIPLYFLLGTIIIGLFLSLTVIRNIKFNNIDEVIDAVKYISLSNSADSYSESEGDLLLYDTTVCFDKFGHNVNFLSPTYSLKSIAISWIPRSLWDMKPVSFGYVLNAVKEGKYQNLNNPTKIYYSGAIDWAAGIAGEGWAHGGWVGLTLYSFIFGILSGWSAKMYFKLINSSNFLSVLLALTFFQLSFCFIRGSLQSQLTPALYSLLLIILVIKLCYPLRFAKNYSA